MAPVFFCWLYCKDYKKLIPDVFQPHIVFPALLYIIVFAGLFFSNDLKASISTLSTKIPLLTFPAILSVASVVDRALIKKAGHQFTVAVSASLFIALAYALIDVYRTGEETILINETIYVKWKWYGLTRISSEWSPTYVAACANLALAFQCYNLFDIENTHKKRTWLITLFLFIFLAICIFLLNSMIGVFCLFCVLVYAGILTLKHFSVKPLYRLSLLLVLVGAALVFFYANPLKIQKLDDLKTYPLKITDVQGERNLLTMRMAKWNAYATIIQKNWLFGTTEGDIKKVRTETYRKMGYEDLYHYHYNAHNMYLETFAMYGILGFIFFINMLVAPLVLKNYHSYYIPFIIIMAAVFFTESYLQRQQGILLFMVLYALLTNPKGFKEKKAEAAI
jgi:O-antigen ligase